MTVRLIPLAALLAAAGIVLAQPGAAKKDAPPAKKEAVKEPAKPTPGSLEDTLEKALRNSADIKAGEAKVRDAEAELNRVRQQVLTKATALHVDLNQAKRMLAVAEQTMAAQKASFERGTSPMSGMLDAQAMVEKHRGEVEKLETELKSLRGEFAVKGVTSAAFSPAGDSLWVSGFDGSIRIWDAATGAAWLRDSAAGATDPWLPVQLTGAKSTPATVQTTMRERVKKVLDQEVEMNARESPINDALRAVLQASGSNIPVRDTLPKTQGFEPVTLQGKLPVGAWVQAIEDSDPTIQVVVRDYGLLLTTRGGVPEGALRVQDLWHGNYAEIKPKKADEKKP
jgi:Outer membrane efflux protein